MKSKIAIVTGGSRSLGRSMALNLAKNGIDVILTYNRNKAAAEEVVDEIKSAKRKAAAIQLDIAKSHTFEVFAQEIKAVLEKKWQSETFNFLINNANIGISAPLTEVTEPQFDELMNVQLKGPFFLTQNLLPLIADGGRIINISTALTRFTLPGYGAYATMKGGVEVLTKYMARELGPRGITVNVVAPGAVEINPEGENVLDNDIINQFMASQTALGRIGKPEDLGNVIAMLISDEAHWVNAQRIEASGGMFI